MQVWINSYREDPNHTMPFKFLSTEVYSEALESFVIACADAMIFNSERKTVFLAKRAIYAMKGWFTIGGRCYAGETETASIQRIMKRETCLTIGPERFTLIRMHRYFCSHREQPPQEKGGDYLDYIFSVELTVEEIAQVSLDSVEYEQRGLKEFSREDLVALYIEEDIKGVLVDIYDTIFTK